MTASDNAQEPSVHPPNAAAHKGVVAGVFPKGVPQNRILRRPAQPEPESATADERPWTTIGIASASMVVHLRFQKIVAAGNDLSDKNTLQAPGQGTRPTGLPALLL